MKTKTTPYGTRLSALQIYLEKQRIDTFVVEKISNIFYLTGYEASSIQEREALLLVTGKKIILVLHPLHAFSPLSTHYVVEYAEKGNLYTTLLQFVSHTKNIYFEPSLRFNEYQYLKKHIHTIHLVPKSGIVEKLRLIKDTSEIECLKHADNITRTVLNKFVAHIDRYPTEREAALVLKHTLEKKTGQPVAFSPIVASGKNSAIPHHSPDSSSIQSSVTIVDAGARFGGYCGDITRTIAQKPAPPTYERVASVVREAYDDCFTKIRVGMKSKDAFKIAIDIFEKYSLSAFFIHSLGHGVGIDVHELPHLSPFSDEVLEAGMIFSLEPGIYIPGTFGVRYENTVVLTPTGCKELH